MSSLLLVDPVEPEAARLLDGLRAEGIRALHARTTEGARELLCDSTVDVALIDVLSPSETGTMTALCLAREIKGRYPHVRVILTSARHFLSERQLERADCGISGFLAKPYDIAEVVRLLRANVADCPASSRRLWHPDMRSTFRTPTTNGAPESKAESRR